MIEQKLPLMDKQKNTFGAASSLSLSLWTSTDEWSDQPVSDDSPPPFRWWLLPTRAHLTRAESKDGMLHNSTLATKTFGETFVLDGEAGAKTRERARPRLAWCELPV